MIPYLKEFNEKKIKEYKKYIKKSVSNNISIEYGNKKGLEGYLYNYEEELEETPIELIENEKIWMKISPNEIQGCFESIERANGKVGVVGLGLGYFVQEVLKKDLVKEIIVYEINKDIIQLYKNNFGENKKLRIINKDAFEVDSEDFDFFFVDIYQYNLSLDVVKHYKKFKTLHKIKEYSFWGMEHFILSCPTHEIAWVYIPEEWMEMCKDLFERFDQSEYIKYFTPIEKGLALKVLKEFSKIL
ncbi:hypothetical protein [Clostridium tarantellae]|uniref:Class I SAM-dependent methyltransferase n=1 Tax=Clostridium tarantellae TaxID=39493 RepID=A0A6I1MM44_9CLOT|nr:hypothetical protein [Clostridium tarantellae]MPQ44084.1 hypothetical protein [Clostridium tarantellae]